MEAEIVAQAGRIGAVTIATNMAGRGTDILLGGNPEFLAKQELVLAGMKPSETPAAEWDAALQTALNDPPGSWIVQERIAVRRELFPQFDSDGRVTLRDMLIDLAPYLFRGRMSGYLTRLSATGLANVTSGGGQVPPFVVGAEGE